MSSKDIDNRAAQARQGLTQYVGALLTSLKGEDKARAQLIVAALCEESLKLCMNNDAQKFDYFAAKPVLRAASFVLSKRAEEMKADASGLPDSIRRSLMLLSANYSKLAQELSEIVEEDKNSKEQENSNGI